MSQKVSSKFKDSKKTKPGSSRSKKFGSNKDTRERYYKSDQEFKTSSAKHNDVSWYVPDQQILNDAARLPYSIPVGMPYSRSYVGQPMTGLDFAEPGVLTQFVMPTFGESYDANSALNVASRGLYSFVRHMNSGSRNYDSTDLMIYLCAVDSVYSIISWATRIYATICTYHQGNRYTPKMLLHAQHVDFDDFANNLASFRMQLNQRIAKMGSLLVPNVMPIYQRHSWLFSNYYIEGDVIKDQIYQYAPMGYYLFELDSDGAGMLKAKDIRGTESYITISGLMATIDSMIDGLVMEEDFGIMSGDIEKAYGNNVLRLAYVPDLITVNFTYDENVLLQFKNAKGHSVTRDSTSPDHAFLSDMFDITQHKNSLTLEHDYLMVNLPLSAIIGFRDFTGWNGVGPGSSSYLKHAAGLDLAEWSKDTMLDSPHASVDPAENMVSSRGTMAFSVVAGGVMDYTLQDITFGSEWYGSFTITVLRRDRSTLVGNVYDYHYERVMINTLNMATMTYEDCGKQLGRLEAMFNYLARFKFRPEVKVIVSSCADTTANPLVEYNTLDFPSSWDVDNYALVNFNVVKGLHNTAILGEFNVPNIAIRP